MRFCHILWSIAVAQSLLSVHVHADEAPVKVKLWRIYNHRQSSHSSYELKATPTRAGVEVAAWLTLNDEKVRAGAFQLHPKRDDGSYIFTVRCVNERFIRKSRFSIRVRDEASSKSLGATTISLDKARDKPKKVSSSAANQSKLDLPNADANASEEMKQYDEQIEHTDVLIRMVPIPAGDFLMGSPNANEQRTASQTENPLHGKTVIINPSSIATPHENARMDNIGKKEYLVYQATMEGANSYESWIAIDEIDGLLVFEKLDDAKAYAERKKSKRR